MSKAEKLKKYRRLTRKNDSKLIVTVPPELKKDLELQAKRKGRTLSVEVQMRLADSLTRSDLSYDDLWCLINKEALVWKGPANPKPDWVKELHERKNNGE